MNFELGGVNVEAGFPLDVTLLCVGLLAAYFAMGVNDGSITNEPGQTFDVPGLGTITIGDDNVILTQDQPTTFDASNIDDFNF